MTQPCRPERFTYTPAPSPVRVARLVRYAQLLLTRRPERLDLRRAEVDTAAAVLTNTTRRPSLTTQLHAARALLDALAIERDHASRARYRERLAATVVELPTTTGDCGA